MADSADPVSEFAELWRNGQNPDLDQFLKSAGNVSPRQLADLISIDHREHWQQGDRRPIESYFQRFPELRQMPELALDLVYGELLLHEEEGSSAEDELARRFPDLADMLRQQVELHRALTPQPSAESASIPKQFGHFEILRQLGRGGMGTVYLARDTKLQRRIAIKVPNLAGDPDHGRRFLREARMSATLQHPNICHINELGEIDGKHYIAMDYLEGESLATRLLRGPLPIAEAVEITRTLAGALEEAHRAGIIHRDLKPANIINNAKGQPVVTDFGLARQMTSYSAESLSSHTISGTPAYMAPEQVNGEFALIGPATDVYALGVVLYEMLTGTRPFDGPLGTLLARIVTDDPEPPSRRRPEVDARLSANCVKALEKRPGDRFPSMADFGAALDHRLADPSKRTSRSRSRLKGIAIASVAVLALLAIGIAIWRPWQTGANPRSASTPPRLIESDRYAAFVLADRAWALNDEGDLDGAIENSGLALKLDGDCTKALLCRANASIKKKDLDTALIDLERASRLEPGSHLPEVELAWAYNERGDYAQAIAHANSAIQLKSDCGEAYYQRGGALLHQRKFRKAIEDFTTAIKYQQDLVWAYRERALAYKELGENNLAEKDERKADELDAAKGNKKP